jgi:hypothetical protein
MIPSFLLGCGGLGLSASKEEESKRCLEYICTNTLQQQLATMAAADHLSRPRSLETQQNVFSNRFVISLNSANNNDAIKKNKKSVVFIGAVQSIFLSLFNGQCVL